MHDASKITIVLSTTIKQLIYRDISMSLQQSADDIFTKQDTISK